VIRNNAESTSGEKQMSPQINLRHGELMSDGNDATPGLTLRVLIRGLSAAAAAAGTELCA
jgi:hypothetical protein